MHSRTSNRTFGTRAAHHEAQMALSRMITELKISIDAGEQIGALQRQNALDTIRQWRPEIQNCSTADFDDEDVKYLSIVAPTVANHYELVSWLNSLSSDLVMMDPGVGRPAEVGYHPSPITPERLDEGSRLAWSLDSCRQRLVFY